MMKVLSLSWGEIRCHEDDVLYFGKGIPGFESLTKFIIYEPDPEVPVFALQSVDEPAVDLPIVNPFLFFPEYDVKLSQTVQNELEIKNAAEVHIYTVMSFGKTGATLNLLAPLVVNVSSRQGQQVVLHDSGYETKHPLPQVGKQGMSSC